VEYGAASARSRFQLIKGQTELFSYYHVLQQHERSFLTKSAYGAGGTPWYLAQNNNTKV